MTASGSEEVDVSFNSALGQCSERAPVRGK
jgi:hypothetical protein